MNISNKLNRISEEEYRSQSKIPVLVILDDIRSLNNIGSFLERRMLFALKKYTCVGLQLVLRIKTYIKQRSEQLMLFRGNIAHLSLI